MALFITLEGIDGSGKTTLFNGLLNWFISLKEEGKRCECLPTREPGGTILGSDLRAHLLSTTIPVAKSAELLLYAADRAQHVETKIRPALKHGINVLCDRFVDSTFAYQGGGRGWDMKLLYRLHEVACGGNPLWPDLTFFLDLPVEDGLKRARQRNLEKGIEDKEGKFENLDYSFYTKVQQVYRNLTESEERYCYLDATMKPEIILNHAITEIRERALKKLICSQ